MKNVFLTLGLVVSLTMSLVSCTADKINESIPASTTEGRELLSKSNNLDQPIEFLNPVNVSSDELIEYSHYFDDSERAFYEPDGTRITAGRVPTGLQYINQHLQTYRSFYSSGAFRARKVAYKRNGDSWEYLGRRADVGEASTINRWHTINGENYFLLKGIEDDGSTAGIWFRITPGEEAVASNLEEIHFVDGKAEISHDNFRRRLGFRFFNTSESLKEAQEFILEHSTSENRPSS